MIFTNKTDPLGDFVFLIENISFENYLIRSDENWVSPYFFPKTFSKIQNSLKIRINYDKKKFGDNLASINSPFAGDYDAKMKFYCQK